jgi:hypothetical protein
MESRGAVIGNATNSRLFVKRPTGKRHFLSIDSRRVFLRDNVPMWIDLGIAEKGGNVSAITVPTAAFQQYVLLQLPLSGTDAVTGSIYKPAPKLAPVYQKMFTLYRSTAGTLAVLGCPFIVTGAGRRVSLPTATVARTARASPIPATTTNKCRRRASITT